MKKHKIIILSVFTFLFLLGGIFFFSKNNYVEFCNSEQLTLRVEGNSMLPLFENGQILTYVENFYEKCGEKPQKGDIILYKFGIDEKVFIKKIQATQEDNIKIFQNFLEINGDRMKNSVGLEYVFNQAQKDVLELYLSGGKIPQDSYFIFGDNIGNSIDSRMFGAISENDILGKVILD